MLRRVYHICDLGVHITSDFKSSLHCAFIAKAFQKCSLVFILDISRLCQVYISYVRPILEYNSPVWNPWLLQDIRCVERVQHFFNRAIFKRVKLPTMSYADHLLHLDFHSLEYRRVFLLMCFKIVKNVVDHDASAFVHINLSPYGTKGNSIKLSPVSTPRHNFRSNFFSVQIINIWNSLPDTVVTSFSELIFKSRLCTVNLSPLCRCFPF